MVKYLSLLVSLFLAISANAKDITGNKQPATSFLNSTGSAFLNWTDSDFASAAKGMAIAYAHGGGDGAVWSSAEPRTNSQGNKIVIVTLTVTKANTNCRYDVTFSQIGTGIAEGKATVEDKGCK